MQNLTKEELLAVKPNNMKIVELKIDELLDSELGFDAVALVNQPAIEHGFFAFNEDKINEFIFEEVVKDIIKEERGLGKEKVFKKVVDIDGILAFDTIEDALIYAKGIGCEGYHEHEYEGQTFYMPCESHDDPAIEKLAIDVANLPSYVNETSGSEITSLSKDQFFDELPYNVQENLLETLASKGISTAQLKEDGYVIAYEEDFGQKLGFNVYKNDAKPDAWTNDRNGNFKILYKYKGPKDQKNRTFCRRLLDLDLLFRHEDIDKLTIKGANQEFGYYDIFKYKGSFGCRHRWTKVYVYQSKPDLLLPAALIMDKRSREGFAAEEDQMMVTGPLMIPNKTILRIDEEGEPYFVYFSEETVKMIAEKMMAKKMLDKMNIEHDPDSPVDGYMTETWLIEDPENDKQKIFGFNLPKGTWMGTYKINSPEVWKKVKDGTLTGYSIEGFFADRLVQQ